jgi:hypothetical protein
MFTISLGWILSHQRESLIALVLLWMLAVTVFFWKPWLWTTKKRGQKSGRDFFLALWRGAAMSFWGTAVMASAVIWLNTFYSPTNPNQETRPLKAAAMLAVAISLLLLTFFLEGLETAGIDLRDKDEHQLARDPNAAGIFRSMQRMSGFYEGREWAVVALLVAATLLIDKGAYAVPYWRWVNESERMGNGFPIGFALRITLTLLLTTFPFVWIAQSPGKYVARQNSVEFLNYVAARAVYGLLRIFWLIIAFFGVHYPSEVAEKIALKGMKNCAKQRELLPSEFKFFADGLKKYGYGYLISDDIVNIDGEGGCTVVSRTLFYVGMQRTSVLRVFEWEKGFVEGTDKALSGEFAREPKCWAFLAPPIGETVTNEILDSWASLFYARDPSQWTEQGYKTYETSGFYLKPEVQKAAKSIASGEPDSDSLHLELHFSETLPKGDDARPGNQRALIVLSQVAFRTNPGAFPLPESWGEAKPHPYFKRRVHPCLRSTMTFNLPAASNYVFSDPDNTQTFQTTYEGVIHSEETERFRGQLRDPIIFDDEDLKDDETRRKRYDKQHAFELQAYVPRRRRTSGLTKQYVYYIDSSLPAAKYKIVVSTQQEKYGQNPSRLTVPANQVSTVGVDAAAIAGDAPAIGNPAPAVAVGTTVKPAD